MYEHIYDKEKNCYICPLCGNNARKYLRERDFIIFCTTCQRSTDEYNEPLNTILVYEKNGIDKFYRGEIRH